MLEMKLYDLYYSKKQEESCIETAKWNREIYHIPSVIGPNGKEIVYTERVEAGKNPDGEWDDYIFVGKAEMLG